MIGLVTSPLKVGIVGTGYAAKKRAEACLSDRRTELMPFNFYPSFNTQVSLLPPP